MKRSRDRIEIISDILSLLVPGPRPYTHLIYRANLSNSSAVGYLKFLEQKELARKISEKEKMYKECKETYPFGKKFYEITSRGRDFLMFVNSDPTGLVRTGGNLR
jgi:predicted transcriptional regulator